MTSDPGPLTGREVNRTVGALIDAAFDGDEERASELLDGGHPDLAARVTVCLAEAIPGCLEDSDPGVARSFALALAWMFAGCVVRDRDQV
ncbi:MAG TPA: hypothetical protein VIX86_19575, partial [Streptosporangiaceae bacterium]